VTSVDSTSLAASIIHFSPATLRGFYWAITAVAFLNGFLCLVRLKRLNEKHHLYWGAVFVVLSGLVPMSTVLCWIARLLGTAMIVDDSLNHSMQVVDLTNGKTPRPDWTWGHKIGVWFMLKLGWKS